MRRILLVALTAFVATSGTASARLNAVVPWEFDPFGSNLVESDWINHIGCPTDATINTGSPGTYSDPACPTRQGPTDRNHQGLLLAKTGPTANIASAGAELKGVAGEPLTSIGYDIRKHGGASTPLGSHCGAGAPRFNVVTDFGTHFIGCVSPPPVSQTLGRAGRGWRGRRRRRSRRCRRAPRCARSTSSSTRARTPALTTSGWRCSTTSW